MPKRIHSSPDLSPSFTAEGLPNWFYQSDLLTESPNCLTLEKVLKSGQFGVIRSLLRVLEGGAASKVSGVAVSAR